MDDKGALAQTKFGARMVRAVMWKLSIEDDQGQATVVQLVRSEYSVGRTDENTIRLTERNISRRHARLVKQGAAWFLDDLGSYNGCFVNGLRVVDHNPVNVGDLIQLGDYRLELHADEGVAVAPQHPSRQRRADTLSTTLNLAAQTDRLVMVVGPTPGREYMLAHAPQRVGRGEECDICVNHSSVSRWHADLQYVGSSRYEIIDHGSSNGIRINGVELRRGLLDARDLIELGDVVLKFIPTGQVYRPSPEESKQLAALLGVDAEGPAPGQLERVKLAWRSLSTATRWGAMLLAVVAATLLVVTQFVKARRLELVADAPVVTQVDLHQQMLEEAQKLLASGHHLAAHEKALSIPSSSNLRRDPRFLAIETRWGEDLLRTAEGVSALDKRQALLETVAGSESVDAATRRKALDALAALSAAAQNAEASPAGSESTDAGSAPDSGTEAPPTLPTTVASATVSPTEEFSAHTSESAAAPASQKLTKRVTSGRTTAAGTRSTGSTGKTGSEPSATELAMSGNRESLKAARDALRRKVSAGTATDKEVRLLRALCRQLGDATCLR